MAKATFHFLIGFGFEIEFGPGKSQWQPRAYSQYDGLAIFGDLRLLGFAAALNTRLAEVLCLVGDNETSHNINRAEAIKLMLVHDHHIDPDRIHVHPSRLGIVGNVETARHVIRAGYEGIDPFAGMSNAYHLARLEGTPGFPTGLPLFSAEAVWLSDAKSPSEKASRQAYLELRFRAGLAERTAAEAGASASAAVSGRTNRTR